MKDTFTITETAKMLDRHPRTVAKWIKEGVILADKIADRWQITRKEINRIKKLMV